MPCWHFACYSASHCLPRRAFLYLYHAAALPLVAACAGSLRLPAFYTSFSCLTYLTPFCLLLFLSSLPALALFLQDCGGSSALLGRR